MTTAVPDTEPVRLTNLVQVSAPASDTEALG